MALVKRGVEVSIFATETSYLAYLLSVVKLGSEGQPLAQHHSTSYTTKRLRAFVATSLCSANFSKTQYYIQNFIDTTDRQHPHIMCGPLLSCGRIIKEKWPSAAAAPAGNMWAGSRGAEQKAPTNKGKAPEDQPQNLAAIEDALMPQVTNHYSRGKVESWLDS